MACIVLKAQRPVNAAAATPAPIKMALDYRIENRNVKLITTRTSFLLLIPLTKFVFFRDHVKISKAIYIFSVLIKTISLYLI